MLARSSITCDECAGESTIRRNMRSAATSLEAQTPPPRLAEGLRARRERGGGVSSLAIRQPEGPGSYCGEQRGNLCDAVAYGEVGRTAVAIESARRYADCRASESKSDDAVDP